VLLATDGVKVFMLHLMTPVILDILQAHYTAASTALLTATEDQVYFHNITILVPSTWTTSNSWLTVS